MTISEIKTEVQDAARELQNGDTFSAVNRLVDALLLLTLYLEQQHNGAK